MVLLAQSDPDKEEPVLEVKQVSSD